LISDQWHKQAEEEKKQIVPNILGEKRETASLQISKAKCFKVLLMKHHKS